MAKKSGASALLPSKNVLIKQVIIISAAMLAYEMFTRPAAKRFVPNRLT